MCRCNMFAQVFVCVAVCLCENKSAILLDSIPQTYNETNKPTNLNRNTNKRLKISKYDSSNSNNSNINNTYLLARQSDA